MRKEIRAIVPGWVACLVVFTAAALPDQAWSRTLGIAVYILAPAALGALSMGHEYSGGTLSLLLSLPRRRENMYLAKLGALAPMLLMLSAAGFLLGVRPQDEGGLGFVLPLLCGLFIAPWLTMLCRNSLAGMVLTLATPAVVMFGSELAAAVHFGADQTLGAGAVAFKAAVLWWGMLAVSAVAAVSGWRLFMRLEAIDGGGRAFRLPWPRAGTTPTTTMPVFAHRHPLWRLMKKELYLQQLSWVVGGLYAFGWLALWFAKNAIPDLHMPLLFALTALNGFAVSVVAGSLGSAEERQLGTLEWHALLPMSARAQWGMKVGVTVGVACVLGLALPVALASMTGSREIRDGLQPFLSAGAGFAVIVLSVMSLYISSLCASSLQALLWSVAAGSGLMTFASSWFLMLRFGADPGFNPFLPFDVVDVLGAEHGRAAVHAIDGDERPCRFDVCRGTWIAAALCARQSPVGRAELVARVTPAAFAWVVPCDCPDPLVRRAQYISRRGKGPSPCVRSPA
jgi:hypothetical protein